MSVINTLLFFHSFVDLTVIQQCGKLAVIKNDERTVIIFIIAAQKTVRRVDLVLFSSARFSQDSSEVEDLRQSVGHSRGVFHHSSAGEGGDGTPAILCVNYDQNHLHQL